MDNVDPHAIAAVNNPTEGRFRLEVEWADSDRQFDAMLAEIVQKRDEANRGFAERARELDDQIWQTVDEHRGALIEPGKRSFVTIFAKFQFRDVPARTTILDKKGIMQVARRLRVVQRIANPPKIEWRFDQKKFLAWLAKNGDLRVHFEPFLDDVDTRETLSIQPNSGYAVLHDSKRVSPPPITIQKS